LLLSTGEAMVRTRMSKIVISDIRLVETSGGGIV